MCESGLRVGWDNPVRWEKSFIYQEQDDRIDIGIDVFLVHSKDILIKLTTYSLFAL
jgi:hypothetical protein